MKHAASIRRLGLGGLLPGIKINTTVNDFAPIKKMQLQNFREIRGCGLEMS